MQQFDRRDFLRMGGGAIAATTATSLIAMKALAEKSEQQTFKTYLPVVSNGHSHNFDIFARPSGLIYTQAPTGHKLGEIQPGVLDVPQNKLNSIISSYCAENEQCKDTDQQIEKMTEEQVMSLMSLDKLLVEVPKAFHPVVTHPMSVIDSAQLAKLPADADISNVYSYGGNFIAEAPPNKLISEELIFPRLPTTHPDYGSIPLGDSAKWARDRRFGNYYVRVALEKHMIYGCINRRVWHAQAMLKYTPRDYQIFNLHLCGWWRGWTPCIGVYNTGWGRFCFHTCTWNFWRVMFYAALAATSAYLAYWLANAIAAFTASAGVGLLIAAPGVPPPP